MFRIKIVHCFKVRADNFICNLTTVIFLFAYQVWIELTFIVLDWIFIFEVRFRLRLFFFKTSQTVFSDRKIYIFLINEYTSCPIFIINDKRYIRYINVNYFLWIIFFYFELTLKGVSYRVHIKLNFQDLVGYNLPSAEQ